MSPRTFKIAIIGGGPRCLTVLDQLALHTASLNNRLEVTVYDPKEVGEGSHLADQDPCLLTNTLASQVTIYALTHPLDAQSPPTGPSFTDWARAAGYRRVNDTYLVTEQGEPISDGDYLPRALLGVYLRDAFCNITARMPSTVTLRHHRESVVDVEVDGLDQLTLTLSSGDRHQADFLFLTSGHCAEIPTAEHRKFAKFAHDVSKTNPRATFIQNPYPLKKLDQLTADSVVAVQGLGLTAYDVIASLTLARGGRYEGHGYALRYIPSGREPQISVFSRNALPYAARGENQKGIAGRHTPRFFTSAAVENLRAEQDRRSGTRKLDFRSDVLALLKFEMAFAYRCAASGDVVAPDEFEPTSEERKAIDEILDPQWASQCQTFEEFSRRAHDWLSHDLAEAYRGNLTSPVKAATDVIRDSRDAIAAAVEYGGLTAPSHRWFCEHFVGTMNRLAFGPPRHRNAELLALIRVGIVGWAGGPGTSIELCEETGRFVITSRYPHSIHRTLTDTLIVSRLPAYRPENDAGPLPGAMLRRGLIRPFVNEDYHPYGLDLDRDQHPITRDGQAFPTAWVLGYPAEGARFYTHALPRPQRRSTQTLDAERAVTQMLLKMERILAQDIAIQRDQGRPFEAGYAA